MEDLNTLRARINELDSHIVELLNQRAAVSLAVGELKKNSDSPVFMPGREHLLLDALAAAGKGPLSAEQLQSIYRQILSASRALQKTERTAYLGPEGTYSSIAAREFLGASAELVPQKSMFDLFAAVESGECRLGVVPLENSLQGGVGQALDLFLRYPLFIRAEFYLRIRNCLLSRESALSAVNCVYSHSQPLGQCSRWLAANMPGARLAPVESTAAAARRAAAEAGCAAIGHASLAGSLGLNVLARGIEDQPDNWTRFAVIGKEPADRPGPDKSSVIFGAQDTPGSLAAVLNILAGEGVDLSKLESRPNPAESWKYLFFADLACDLGAAEYKGLFDKLKKACSEFRFLGAYPKGPKLSASEDI